MPLYLYWPKGTHNAYIQGTHLGVRVRQTAGTADKRLAEKERKRLEGEIERGRFAADGPTFMTAAIAYLESGRDRRFVGVLADHFGSRPLAEIDQASIDRAAATLYPNGTAQTRNRQVYTPVSAILRHSGVKLDLRRPKGHRSRPRPYVPSPADANALIAAATEMQPRFGAFLTFLFGTGCRLSEAMRLRWDDVDLSAATALIRKTKNGKPRLAHLPPVVVAALANLNPSAECASLLDPASRPSSGGSRAIRLGGSLFRLTKWQLYTWLDTAARNAGVVIPDGVAFHACRHAYGAWMRSYGGLDTSGLVGTGAWDSHEAARTYEHVETSAEARKADLLPIGRKA